MATSPLTSSPVVKPSIPVVKPAAVPSTFRRARRLVAVLLVVCGLLALAYAGVSVYIAAKLVYEDPKPITATPNQFGLDYRNVSFPARDDGVLIRGWLIPGVLPDGRQTLDRTLIMVHGARQNRTDLDAGLLPLSAALAHRGFAVLALDMRGEGESAPAGFSFGQYEERDVLGAVDFLRTGTLPYPALGHPRAVGGWGVSMGSNALVYAAVREPAIRALVLDSSWPEVISLLQREIPKSANLPNIFTSGALVAAHALYDIDFYAVRPVDEVGSLAPRPVLFIHGTRDDYTVPANLDTMVTAASVPANAHVQSWLVPGAKHAQAYNVMKTVYVNRLVDFYTAALGPDAHA